LDSAALARGLGAEHSDPINGDAPKTSQNDDERQNQACKARQKRFLDALNVMQFT
jgi:hypothetical protein